MFNIDFGNDLQKLYDALEVFGKDFEDQCLKGALKEAAEPIKKRMVRNIKSAANKGYSTGEAAKSVKAVLNKEKGVVTGITIYPRGQTKRDALRNRRSKEQREKIMKSGSETKIKRLEHQIYNLTNMDKVCWMEFGTSKQKPTPVMQPAFSDSAKEVEDILLKNFKKYAEDKGLI